ncbi:MAG: secretin and TonB N-terminal domain-containing protein [Oligoflexia bacterium]|nr:secretin and TonB N-terminal domain-containing protein [Oligoflexia bacterium]
MIKNILFVFIFLFHFSIANSYALIAQTDSVFDDSDLADIEGLDGSDEDSELEEEFGDLSDDSVEDNFEAEDFEVLEEESQEEPADSKDKEDDVMLEDDFDKDDYEVLSDKPGYEIITDEELEKEFSDEDDDESSEEDEESEDEPSDSEDMESVDESSDSEDMESVDESSDSEDWDSEDEPSDSEDRVSEDESSDSEDRESVDSEDMELEDDPAEDIESEDSESADKELEQLKTDIESMEETEEELEGLEEEIDQTTEEEEQLRREEEQIQREREKQEQDNQEEDLGLEEPEALEEPAIEGLPVEEEADVSGLNSITNIRYLTEKDQIVIDTSEIASYQERNNSETNQLIIEILQSQLGENLHWPYVLRDFNTDFGLIKADQKDSSTVRVIIQLKEGAGFPKTTLSQEGNQIIIGYGDILNNEIVPEDQAQSADSDLSSILPAKTLEDLYFGNVEFSGTPVSFHVIDAPIKQVLRFISEESGLNMVIDESVSGTVTLKLEDVPWDQALHTIFKVKSLGYTRDGNVITILPLSKIEERTRKLKEISDRQKSLSPFKTKVIPIMFTKAVDIEKQVKEFSTPAGQGLFKGGRIIVHEESNTLVVVDTEAVIKKISAMAKFLDKPPQQVMIEAKIVEVTKSFAKNFGFNWDLGGDLPVSIGASGLLDIFTQQFWKDTYDGLGGSYQTSYSKGGGSESIFDLNGLPLIGNIDATLNLAENDGSAQVLSTVKILTKSGQDASITKNTPILILQGRNTALGAGAGGGTAGTATTGAVGNTGGAPGVVQETTQTQDITLSLQVTPIVTSSGNIAVQTNVNLSTPGGEGGAFKTDRTAQTEVLTKSGQTVVVSGIYQKSETQTKEGIPWLKEIPFLGWMFKNKNSNFAESEMLMFVTPTLVEQ